MFAAAGATFTVEEAVESIGFGRFHVLLFFIMGSSNVRKQPLSTWSSGGTSLSRIFFDLALRKDTVLRLTSVFLCISFKLQ